MQTMEDPRNKVIAAGIVVILVGILSALSGVHPANAAGASTPTGQREALQKKIDAIKKRTEYISREIEKSRQEVDNFNHREADTIRQLNQVERALDKSRRRAAALKAEIRQLDLQIAEAQKQFQKLDKTVRANEEYVARRLVAMYKMNWLGKFHLLASAESLHEFMQRKAALEHILSHDEKVRQQLMENRRKLEAVLGQLERHQAAKRAQMKEYRRQMQIMAHEKTIRNKLLADIRSQKSLELAVIKALTFNARQLDRKIKSLSDRLAAGRRINNGTQKRFSAHKGLLIMPVKGKIISLYGAYKNRKYHITNFRSGIEIKADRGTPVRSIFGGRVIYAGWFKGYGNMIIIDHGANFYSVYAHLEELFASKGDMVNSGQVIATVGDSGSLTGPRLYFEIRHHGKPENPLQWIKTG